MFEEKFFLRRKKDPCKLRNYGFTEDAEGYRYAASVMDGQFTLHILIPNHGPVTTKMIDSASGEEYALYKVTSAAGSFVGEVRAACDAVLTDISQKCYAPDVFCSSHTLAVLEYAREKYGDQPEFLWEKYPDTAVLRRKDSGKWYVLLFAISKKKLGLPANEVAEMIDLRLAPEKMQETIDHEKYFPGWHMNKKSWYTMILDGSVSTEELFRRIDRSYTLAVK